MELNNLVFDKYSVSGLRKKVVVSSIYLAIFVVLFALSIVLFVASFMRAVNDTLNFVLVVFLILANALYVANCIILIVKTNKTIKLICEKGNITQKLKTPLKIDLNKKFSSLEILYIVYDVIIAFATIFTIIALCLNFEFGLLSNLGLMILILTFSSFNTIIILQDKEMYKFMCLKQKQENEKKLEDKGNEKGEENNN